MKRVIIADIRSVKKDGDIPGHFVPVAQNYIDVLGNKYKVFVAGGDVYYKHFQKESVIKLPYNISGNSIIDKIKVFVNSWVLFNNAGKDIIIIQQASLVTTFLAIALLYWSTGKLFLIVYNTAALNTRLKKFLYYFAKRKISGIICSSKEIGDLYDKPFCKVSDYIKPYIPQFIPFNKKTYDFCILGGIYEDKGTVDAAKFFGGTPYKVIIAGKDNEPGIGKKMLEATEGANNIDLQMRYISSAEYSNYMSNSKYCVLNYRGTYFDRSSGVVLDAILAGTPVVGAECKALDFVKKNELGYVYKDISDINLSNIMNQDTYDNYILNIEKYFNIQKEYAKELVLFIDK